jgi:transposase
MADDCYSDLSPHHSLLLIKDLRSLVLAIDKELKRKGVTRRLLWEEYRHHHPDGVGLSQFKRYFSQWKAQVNPTMHMQSSC